MMRRAEWMVWAEAERPPLGRKSEQQAFTPRWRYISAAMEIVKWKAVPCGARGDTHNRPSCGRRTPCGRDGRQRHHVQIVRHRRAGDVGHAFRFSHLFS